MKALMRLKEFSQETGIPVTRLRKITASDKGKNQFTLQRGEKGWVYVKTAEFLERFNNGEFNTIF